MYIKRKTITTVVVVIIVALLVVGILAAITKGFKDWTFGSKVKDDGVQTLVAKFDFGEKQSAGPEDEENGLHNDGVVVNNKLEIENEDYALSIINATNLYNNALDKVGNSCLKLGTRNAEGSFTIKAPDDVLLIKIAIAGYKAGAAQISVNGGQAIVVETTSDNGEYTVYEIVVPSNGNVTISTCNGDYRAMIDYIEFYA